MATNKSSEASRNGVGFGRAAAMVAACGLILGVSGTSSSAPPIAGLQLSSGNLQDSPGVAVPASAALSFRPPVTIMAGGATGAGLVPGLGGLPGLPGSPGSPGLPGSPGFSGGLAGGSSVPGSNLFVQPGPASARGSLADVVPYAYQGLGHPYVWGGTSFTSGWDCSGFVQWAFAQAGFQLPRVSQWVPLQPTQNPSPGDLVTQRPDGPNHWGHVGIYVGDGMMISALNPDQGTIKHSIGPAGTSWFFTLPGTVRTGPDPSDAPGSGLSATVPGLSFPSVSGTNGGSSGGGGSVNASSSDQRNDGPSKSRKGSDAKRDRTPNTFKNDSFSVPGTSRPTPSPTDKPKSHDPSRPSGQGTPDKPKSSHQTPDKKAGSGTTTGTNPGGTGTKPGSGNSTGTKPGGTGTTSPKPTPGGTGTTKPKPTPDGTGTTQPNPTPGTDTGSDTPPATNTPNPAPPVDKTPPATPPADQAPAPAPKPDSKPEPQPTVEKPTAPVTEQPATPAPPTTPATPEVLNPGQIAALLAKGAAALAAGDPGSLGTPVTDPKAGDLVYYPADGATPARVGVYLADGTVLLNGAATPPPVEAGVTYYRVS